MSLSDTLSTFKRLWQEFLPLSISDITMAATEPFTTTAVAHSPNAQLNLAALGAGKALAILLESPIIMILHAANAVAPSAIARTILWRFTLLTGGILSLLLGLFATPWLFTHLIQPLLGVSGELADHTRIIIAWLMVWPFVIGWRRYYQGLLIRAGHARPVALAGIARLISLIGTLLIGYNLGLPGYTLAPIAMVVGVCIEAALVTRSTQASVYEQLDAIPHQASTPTTHAELWRFYWPLATAMLVVWSGRALLVGLLARAIDAPLALAAWPTAWGFVILIGNATRTVQQVIIRHIHDTPSATLWLFALSVGGVFASLLGLIAHHPLGQAILASFVANDPDLLGRVIPTISLCATIPLLFALQNAAQGFMIAHGTTSRVGLATWVSTTTLLAVGATLVYTGTPGTHAAALATITGLSVETLLLLKAPGRERAADKNADVPEPPPAHSPKHASS
jgi:hypothetical protein